MHTSVLLSEVLRLSAPVFLAKQPVRFIDCNLGFGGHTKAIMKLYDVPGHHTMGVIGIDLDQANLARAQENIGTQENPVTYVHDSFAHLTEIASNAHWDYADLILFDVGLSSMHVDEAARGFSYRKEGPLDMRFDVTQELSAHVIVNEYSEAELMRIGYTYGEEKHSKLIARRILEARKKHSIDTTTELTNIIQSCFPTRVHHTHPEQRFFQALRIETNDELEALTQGVEAAISLLSVGGRLLVITFHSLEDRIVKHILKKYTKACICPITSIQCTCNHMPEISIITKRPITPSDEEIASNPRARSAKLRVCEKLSNV